MSGNALKRLGICTSDQNPIVGVLVTLTPATFLQVKKQLLPILAAAGDSGVWTTGGAGSWDPDHPYFDKGTYKIESGDVDVWLDARHLCEPLGLPVASTEKNVRATLAARMSNHFPTTQIGINVHLAVPGGYDVLVSPTGNKLPAYYQVDLMTADYAHEIAQHHEHDYSIKNTPYKGKDQQLAMASLVNSIPGHADKTFMYHGMGGSLKNRATGELVTRNIDEIAKLLLGSNALASDLANVESIISAVQGGLSSYRLAQFVSDMKKSNV